MIQSQFFQIAIDGPVAAGKGTIAKMLASKLKFLYVDTGAMYRTIALACLNNNQCIDENHQEEIVKLFESSDLHLQNALDEFGTLFTLVSLNGKDVSQQIRTQVVSLATSKIATLPKIRQALVAKQQLLAKKFNVVMEGRDIGLRVLPEAQLKLYLTADLDERTRRRLAQIQLDEPSITFEEMKKQIQERDERDMTRASDPLTIVPDAITIDTTHLNIDQVVNNIVGLVRAHRSHLV